MGPYLMPILRTLENLLYLQFKIIGVGRFRVLEQRRFINATLHYIILLCHASVMRIFIKYISLNYR